jgi:hypothetical protein
MDLAALTVGASAVLALIILSQDGEPFRNRWVKQNGHLPSLARIPLKGEAVPFELIKNNPILPVLLDGDEHLTCWIVDTGYGFSAVDVRLAKRLNLPITGSLVVQTLQNDDLQSTVVPKGFIFDLQTNTPDVEIPPHSAVIRDLPQTLENTHGRFSRCLKPGGILGITFLRNFVTRLDYLNHTLTFFDPSRFEYRGKGQKFTNWLEAEHYFLIPMKLGGVTANLALDSGAFSTILTRGFLEKYKRKTGEDFRTPSSRTHRQVGQDGGRVSTTFSEKVIDLTRRYIPEVEIGDATLNSVEVLFPDGETPGLLDTTRFDGLMGYNVLKHFVIYLVYQPEPYVILEGGT